MKKMIFSLVLVIASSVWMTNEAGNWCMPAAQTSTEQPIRIGGTFQTDIFPCVDETEPCPPCLTIVLASGGHYYLVSDDPQVLAILDTISIGSFAIIEGNHYLEGHYDFIHVTHIFFPETDITQLTGEWEVYKETVSTPTGDAGTRCFSTHDVNYTNYIIENNSIYKVVLDQASGYAHYSDIVPYSIDKKENGTWLLTAEGMFSSSDPVEEGIPTPVTIYKLTENEIEWMYAANGGDEGPSFYYQYLRRYTYAQNDKLPSLCDQWNVLAFRSHMGYAPDEYETQHYRLNSDTVINGIRFTKLYRDDTYSGAMREGTNRDIYYIPADSTHEYLLYTFNVQVGDTLPNNVWFGISNGDFLSIKTATIKEIKPTYPRTFVIDLEYWSHGILESSHTEREWIEGVGMPTAPDGEFFMPLAGGFSNILLCAYKNGEQVYVSDWGEQYGCEYNQTPLLPSLCDEWNVWHESFESFGPINFNQVIKYRLTTDTIINGQTYLRLVSGSSTYVGALREGNNRDIYYIPEWQTHEYLLYAFNAQVGDTLSNLWAGGFGDSYQAVVQAISDGTTRIFTIDVKYEYEPGSIQWIEGVGSPETPMGKAVVPDVPADLGVYTLLCAYKNGEQVYVSEMGKQYNCGEDASDAMFPPETRWNYEHTEIYGGPDDNYVFTLQPMDTIIGNTRYQQIGSFLFRSKGAKVWCAVDSMGIFVERLVYDFDLQVGDSIRAIYYGYDRESAGTNLPQYAKVTSVEQTYLADGRYARRISYDGFRPDDIEHIGSIEGILTPLNLPVPTCGCSDLFQCCTKSDYLLYEVAQGACDTFLLKEQPSDTIPLFTYIGDDPGSSTVDPVDPNQVVATLRGDELTIREHTGVDIAYSLQHNAPTKMPAHSQASTSDTFRYEITLQITESGEYQLLLTNPSWDYSIYGTFFYLPQGIESVHSTSVPQKVLQNGHFYILRNEKIYTITGQKLK